MWTVSDQDDVKLIYKVILIKPDDSSDTLAVGITSTSYNFVSTEYPDADDYQIIVEIIDGIDSTELQSPFFEIKNKKFKISLGLEFILVLFTLSIIILRVRKWE